MTKLLDANDINVIIYLLCHCICLFQKKQNYFPSSYLPFFLYFKDGLLNF